MSIIAVIPARGGSKRLPRKNIYPVFGKPMLGWAVEACKRSKYIDEVYVSTEDNEIADIALKFGADIIRRSEDLADDVTPKMEVIRHADQWYLEQKGKHPDILLSVQANSPELNHVDMDKGIELLKNNNLWEVISVGTDYVQNASFRVIKQICLYNTFLSAHLGVVINDCLDVHTIEDVDDLEKKYKTIDNFINAVSK